MDEAFLSSIIRGSTNGPKSYDMQQSEESESDEGGYKMNRVRGKKLVDSFAGAVEPSDSSEESSSEDIPNKDVIRDGRGNATFLAPRTSGGDAVSMAQLLASAGDTKARKRLDSVLLTDVDVSRVSLHGLQQATRVVARKEAKKELGEWVSVIDENRRQRAVVFDTRGSADKAAADDTSNSIAKKSPLSALEEQLCAIHESREQLEGVKAAELNKKNERKEMMELAVLRARLSSQAAKLARWSKIKSKGFRKAHRKALNGKEIKDLESDGVVERVRAERDRAAKNSNDVGAQLSNGVLEEQPRNEEEVRAQLKAIAGASDDLSAMPFGDLPVIKAVSKRRKKEAQGLLDMLNGKVNRGTDAGVGVMSLGPGAGRSSGGAGGSNFIGFGQTTKGDSTDETMEDVDLRSKGELGQAIKARGEAKIASALSDLAKQRIRKGAHDAGDLDGDTMEMAEDIPQAKETNIPVIITDERGDRTFLPTQDEQEVILGGIGGGKPNAGMNSFGTGLKRQTESIMITSKDTDEKERKELLQDAFGGASSVDGGLLSAMKESEELGGNEIAALSKEAQEVQMPGWGTWVTVDNKGERPRPTRKAKIAHAKRCKKLEEALHNRQDSSMPNVFVSQKALDNTALKLPKVPSHFRTVEEFSNANRVPLGREFTTAAEFRRSVMPAVIVKGHGPISPVTQKELEAAQKRKKAVEKHLVAAKGLERSHQRNIPRSGLAKQRRTGKF